MNNNEQENITNQEDNFELLCYALNNEFDTLKSLLIKNHTYDLHYNDDSIFLCALRNKNYDFISFLVLECNFDSNSNITKMIHLYPDIQKMFVIRDLYLSIDKNIEEYEYNCLPAIKKNKL